MTEYLYYSDTSVSGSMQTVFYAGKSVFIGGIRDTDNQIFVGKIDEFGTQTASVLQSSLLGDVHSNPGITVDAQGYVYACTSDGGADIPRIYKSATPYGLDFSQVSTVPFGTGFEVRYPTLILDSAGDLWLFGNINPDGSPSNRDIAYTKSTDGGLTWGSWTTLWDAAGSRAYFSVQLVDGEFLVAIAKENTFDVSDGNSDCFFLRYSGGSWLDASGTAYTLPVSAITGDVAFDSSVAGANTGFSTLAQKDSQGRYFMLVPGYVGGVVADVHLCRYEAGSWSQQALPLEFSDYNSVVPKSETEYSFTTLVVVSGVRQVVEFTTTDDGATWSSEQLTTGELTRERGAIRKVFGDNPDFYFVYCDTSRSDNVTWTTDLYGLFANTGDWAKSYNLEFRDTTTMSITQVMDLKTTEYQLNGLTEGEQYEFRVQETHGPSTSAFSNWVQFTTTGGSVLVNLSEQATTQNILSTIVASNNSITESNEVNSSFNSTSSVVSSVSDLASASDTLNDISQAVLSVEEIGGEILDSYQSSAFAEASITSSTEPLDSWSYTPISSNEIRSLLMSSITISAALKSQRIKFKP